MGINKDFDQALDYNKKKFDALKVSLWPFAMHTAMNLSSFLPFGLTYICGDYFTRKVTMTFSCVNGLKKRINILGKKSTGVFGLPPLPREMACAFGMVSNGDLSNLSVMADDCAIKKSARNH